MCAVLLQMQQTKGGDHTPMDFGGGGGFRSPGQRLMRTVLS